MAAFSEHMTVIAPDRVSLIRQLARSARSAGMPLWLRAKRRKAAADAWESAVENATNGDQDLQLGPDGIPHALSIIAGRKGYRHDAERHGQGLLIRLDGVEQREAVAYDVDAGLVARYARHSDGTVKMQRLGAFTGTGLVIDSSHGIVTVERRL